METWYIYTPKYTQMMSYRDNGEKLREYRSYIPVDCKCIGKVQILAEYEGYTVMKILWLKS